MSSDKNKFISNYFKVFEAEYPTFRKAAKYGTGFIILGILLFYMQFILVLQEIDLLATIFIVIGIFSFWLWVRPYFFLKKMFYTRPADGDMDVWFLEDMHDVVKPKALEHLRINPSSLKEENIIIIPYPVYWAYPGVDPATIIRRPGDDGQFTYSTWCVQILIVTENFISYYSCIYDWINDSVFDERTNEYFFDDISSVRNDIEFLDYKLIDDEEQKVGNAKVFKITNMSSDSLTLITDIPSLKVPASYTNNLERLVQAIRIMLRNRRYGEEIELEDENSDVEFEVTSTTDGSGKEKSEGDDYFHQQLRHIYKDYYKGRNRGDDEFQEYEKELEGDEA